MSKITESKDLIAFDTKVSDLMPVSRTIIQTKYRQYLLFNNTNTSTFTVKELIDQVYPFSRIYWKSVKQQNLPVTIKYPEMVAEMLSHFDSKGMSEFEKDKLWFL